LGMKAEGAECNGKVFDREHGCDLAARTLR
jgi:hypothetical protein